MSLYLSLQKQSDMIFTELVSIIIYNTQRSPTSTEFSTNNSLTLQSHEQKSFENN